MWPIGSVPEAEMRFPLEMLRCPTCTLVQIGYEVDSRILFPHSYPYLSGTTRILRENFQDLCAKAQQIIGLKSDDLVIDIGANDGTLLTPFQQAGFRVLGIEPSQAADLASSRGIAMVKDYFNTRVASEVRERYGAARLITATNVFAHISGVHDVVSAIQHLLAPNGVFVSESHYVSGLVETLQYDTIYHEHLRYYSVGSLMELFKSHELEIFRVEAIPTHGGSIRVYTAKAGQLPVDPSVRSFLEKEATAGITDGQAFRDFRRRVVDSRLQLLALLHDLKKGGVRIYGIGAPSRASTLINYCGLDDGLVDCVLEVSASHKLNKYVPGTRVPVLDESKLFSDPAEYALLYSWHIAGELSENLRRKGFRGKFIVPLPEPRVL
jgi:SAM-dependent methyltransferase